MSRINPTYKYREEKNIVGYQITSFILLVLTCFSNLKILTSHELCLKFLPEVISPFQHGPNHPLDDRNHKFTQFQDQITARYRVLISKNGQNINPYSYRRQVLYG